jgi:hypothetical protein
MSCRMRRRGIKSRAAEDKAMYSLSVVDKAISDCSLLLHVTGYPQKVITKPVRDNTLSQRWLYSRCHRPAKSASTYISRAKDGCGLRVKP